MFNKKKELLKFKSIRRQKHPHHFQKYIKKITPFNDKAMKKTYTWFMSLLLVFLSRRNVKSSPKRNYGTDIVQIK